jgi:glutaredoxin-like protein
MPLVVGHGPGGRVENRSHSPFQSGDRAPFVSGAIWASTVGLSWNARSADFTPWSAAVPFAPGQFEIALSPQLGLSLFDLQQDAAIAEQYRVDKAPAFVIAAKNGETLTNTGVQYSGIPSEHEFTTLIQDILLVSSRDSGLKPATREFLKGLQKPIHLQVFVTPTCPYCPRAVVLAHQMAIENPGMIRAEGVESMEFQELAEQFHVGGVPQTTINSGAGTVVGAVPEANLLAEIQRIAA